MKLGYGVGIGPITSRFTVTVTKIVLNRVGKITGRDRLAKEAAVACGIDKERVRIMIDPAVGLFPVRETYPQDMTNNSRKRIAIVPRRLFRRDSSLLPVKFGRYGHRRKQRFAEFVDILAQANIY